MEQVLSKNAFYTFKPTTKGTKTSNLKNFQRGTFDQPLPDIRATKVRSNSDYWLDSFSDIVSNQSLSQEQINRVQLKTTNEKLNALFQRYETNESESVKSFLLKNRFLILLLEEAQNKIFQYFGKNQNIALKISHEPEFPNSSELWIEILTELSAKESLPILDKFDEEWWLENIEKADCKLNIILKFV